MEKHGKEALEKYARSLIADQCFKAYESLMKPFENFKGKDIQIDALLLTARVSYDMNYYIIEGLDSRLHWKYLLFAENSIQIIPLVPSMASKIYSWVSSNFSVTAKEMENYNKNVS